MIVYFHISKSLYTHTAKIWYPVEFMFEQMVFDILIHIKETNITK